MSRNRQNWARMNEVKSVADADPETGLRAVGALDAEVIAARKREISPERTTDQMQSLSVLSGSKGVLALDALKPLDENMEAVLKQLFPSWSEAR